MRGMKSGGREMLDNLFAIVVVLDCLVVACWNVNRRLELKSLSGQKDVLCAAVNKY